MTQNTDEENHAMSVHDSVLAKRYLEYQEVSEVCYIFVYSSVRKLKISLHGRDVLNQRDIYSRLRRKLSISHT